MTPRVDRHKNNPKERRVIDDFKKYKSNNDEGTLFGRDAIIERPSDTHDNEVFHVHLLDEKKFRIKRLYLKDQYYRTSDSFLLYCSGEGNKNYYLLIAIVWQKAHEFLNNQTDLLIEYGREAERFRDIY